MAISKLKKRYNVSMAPEIVERFQLLSREFGLHPSFMSAACQYGVETFLSVFLLARDQGTVSQSDILILLAKNTKKFESMKLKNLRKLE